MQIFNCQNNLSFIQKNQKGFSLIECVIAVGLLATVVGSMIALQSSILRILQNSIEQRKAEIIMDSTKAQIEYVLSIKEQNDFPKDTKLPTPFDPLFKSQVTRVDKTKIKLSQFLISAMKIYNLANGQNALNIDVLAQQYAAGLDAYLPPLESNFMDISNIVTWKNGKNEKKISTTMFIINNNFINMEKSESKPKSEPQPPKPK